MSDKTAKLCILLGTNEDKRNFCFGSNNSIDLHDIFVNLTDVEYHDKTGVYELEILHAIAENQFTATETLIAIDSFLDKIKNKKNSLLIKQVVLSHKNYPIQRVTQQIELWKKNVNLNYYLIAACLKHPEIPDKIIDQFSQVKYRRFPLIYAIILQKSKDIKFLHTSYGELVENFFFDDFLIPFLFNVNIEPHMIHSIILKNIENYSFILNLVNNNSIINHPKISIATLELLKQVIHLSDIEESIENRIEYLTDTEDDD